MGQTWRHLVSDSQYRWIGPEKGVIHLALGAIVNALWDLWSKVEKKPLWKLVADFTPEEFVRCIDFRYITDAITPEGAVVLLKAQEGTKAQRVEDALRDRAVPAYTTSAGWLGYGEDKMERLLRETKEAGYRHFKIKVGGSVEEDRKRLTIVRRVLGYDQGNVVMVDANQVWSVPEAIEYMKQLVEFKPWYAACMTTKAGGLTLICIVGLLRNPHPQMISSATRLSGKRSSHMVLVLPPAKCARIVSCSSSS